MKAATLWQPWASLLAANLKLYETRSWSTNYRGKIAIHAAKRSPPMVDWPIELLEKVVIKIGAFSRLPRGAIVAIADLVDVVRTEDIKRGDMPMYEHLLGDFSPGRFAWKLENVVRVLDPIKVSGFQRLWDWHPQWVEVTTWVDSEDRERIHKRLDRAGIVWGETQWMQRSKMVCVASQHAEEAKRILERRLNR